MTSNGGPESKTKILILQRPAGVRDPRPDIPNASPNPNGNGNGNPKSNGGSAPETDSAHAHAHAAALAVVAEHERHPEIWAPGVERVQAPTVARMLAMLRERPDEFAGVFVDTHQLVQARRVAMGMQFEEILDNIADGVAVLDPYERLTWFNPRFRALVGEESVVLGARLLEALRKPEVLGDEPCPLTTARQTGKPTDADYRLDSGLHLRVTVTPVRVRPDEPVDHFIVFARDVTPEYQQRQKLEAVHNAGEALADLRPDNIKDMSVDERKEVLKANIVHHMKEQLGLVSFEIRKLDPLTNRLLPLVAEGMTPEAADRPLLALKEGHGVTGHVAATGQSYICPDTRNDPLYIPGAPDARASLTIPLVDHGEVVGTLNVESAIADAFDESDRQFLEIYARGAAAALRTLDLLETEKLATTRDILATVREEISLPIDRILSNATRILDRYAGHDDDIIARLKAVIHDARALGRRVENAAAAIVALDTDGGDDPALKPLRGRTILVADADDNLRVQVHKILEHAGADVETVTDAETALCQIRHNNYDLAVVDIRLPDMPGFPLFQKLRELRPDMPVAFLKTIADYDPGHQEVKARAAGLRHTIGKPVRPHLLLKTVVQAIEDGPPPPPPNPGPRPARQSGDSDSPTIM